METLTRGVCLASCFLPLNDDNCRWWLRLQQELERRGIDLVLLSQSGACDPRLRVIIVPLWLQGYAEEFGNSRQAPALEPTLAEALAGRDQAWTGGRAADSLAGLAACQEVLRSILNELQPVAVLVWSSSVPQSIVLQQLALQQGRPCWVLERGLLPQTLMLEICGHGGHSELNWSFALRHALQTDQRTHRFSAAQNTYRKGKANKYPLGEPEEPAAIRQRLQLQDRKVIGVLLQHDSASALAPRSFLGSRIHAPGIGSCAEALEALTAVQPPETHLLVKPHPMDQTDYSRWQNERVAICRDINLHSLLDLADVVACMNTSTQFEALLYEKPVMLLARSALFAKGIAYEGLTIGSLRRAFQAALNREDFDLRKTRSRRFLNFILEHFSVGLADDMPAGQTLTHLADFIAQNALPFDFAKDLAGRLAGVKREFDSRTERRALGGVPAVAQGPSNATDSLRGFLLPGTRRLEVFAVATREEFEHVRAKYLEELLRQQETLLPKRKEAFKLFGVCAVCGRETQFVTDFLFSRPDAQGRHNPSWRERQVCQCGLNCRQRSCFHLLADGLGLGHNAQIYCTEQQSQLFRHIRRVFPRAEGSEYLGETVPLGQRNPEGILNQDVTQLTFQDSRFDCIFSLDVMEHVPGYRAGFRELARCLKTGGLLLLTIPFHFGSDKTVIRASVGADGALIHHLPEVYHGDPLNSKGALCFNDFGWDLLPLLRQSGFSDVVLLAFSAPHYGYVGLQYAILATCHKAAQGSRIPLGSLREQLRSRSLESPQNTFNEPTQVTPQPSDLRRDAAALFGRGAWAEAGQLYMQLSRLAPDELEVWRRRCECSRQQGHQVLARLIREEALERHPHWAAVFPGSSAQPSVTQKREVPEPTSLAIHALNKAPARMNHPTPTRSTREGHPVA